MQQKSSLCTPSPTTGPSSSACSVCWTYPPAIAHGPADTSPRTVKSAQACAPVSQLGCRDGWRDAGPVLFCSLRPTHASYTPPRRTRNDAAQTQARPQALNGDQAGCSSLRSCARDRWRKLASDDPRDVRCAGPEPRGRCPGRAGEALCWLRARPAMAAAPPSASMRASAGPSFRIYATDCVLSRLCLSNVHAATRGFTR